MFCNSFGHLGQILSGFPAEILYFTRQFAISCLSSRNIVTRMSSSLCLGKSSIIKMIFLDYYTLKISCDVNLGNV